MDTAECKAIKVLAFARQHDWGRDAMVYEVQGRWFIKNLIEWRMMQGEWVQVNLTMPAKMQRLREWAGY